MRMTKEQGSDKKPVPFELDFSSSKQFYEQLLKQVFGELRKRRGIRLSRMDDGRQQEIITMHAAGKTLDEIGKQFGVTRERIRQIERKVWLLVGQFKPNLKILESMLASLLRRNGSFDRLSHLKELFQNNTGWTLKETDYLLDHYLGSLSDRFEIIGDKKSPDLYITLNDYPCWKCGHFLQLVKDQVHQVESDNNSLTLDEFARQIRQIMTDNPECVNCLATGGKGNLKGNLSPELFLWLFKTDDLLRHSQEKMTIRRGSQFPGLNRSVLLVLKMARRPLSKREILAELKKMFPRKSFTLKQIQSTTSNSPQCFDEIYLWDRGGIHSETLYIHKDYIKTDLPILEKIEQKLRAEAAKGRVPQIRLNRIFNAEVDNCIKEGIPNVYALFSSLKVRGCSEFTFQRSPYIGFAGNRQKISNAKILEQYVADQGRPVSRQEMREFGRTLGLLDEHISNTIVLTDLLVTQTGYVLLNDFPVDGPEFTQLLDRITEALSKRGSYHISDLYFYEKMVCDQLGIIDGVMLYSVLRRYAEERFLLRYPMVFARRKRRTRKTEEE